MASSWEEKHLLRGSVQEGSHHVSRARNRDELTTAFDPEVENLLDTQSELSVSFSEGDVVSAGTTSNGSAHPHSYGSILHGTNVSKVTLNEFDHFPVRIVCPNCQEEVQTTVHHRPGKLTWYTCGMLTLVFLCWLPFCVDFLRDAHHICPTCGHTIGVFRQPISYH